MAPVTVSVADGPAIMIGYEYRLQIEADHLTGTAETRTLRLEDGSLAQQPANRQVAAACRVLELAEITHRRPPWNIAGVMDAVFPGEPIDYAAQKDLVMARIDEATDEYWDVVMRVNVTGVFKCMRTELRQMLAQKRGGTIVNVASVAGLRGFGGTPSYVASKHAVNGLTKNAAIDYAPYGIRVNSVCMANTATPMVDRAMALIRQRAQDDLGARHLGGGRIHFAVSVHLAARQSFGGLGKRKRATRALRMRLAVQPGAYTGPAASQLRVRAPEGVRTWGFLPKTLSKRPIPFHRRSVNLVWRGRNDLLGRFPGHLTRF
mgnify:CR=1 FL=1